MTLPTSYSWFLEGERLRVPYQAPQGRRVNAIGAYFTHGPAAGRFEFQSWAVLPKSRAKRPRATPEQRAATHGLRVEEVGPIDAERVLAFVWKVAGRGAEGEAAWQRERPLVIAWDNYSVHTSQVLQDARPLLEAAEVHLVSLARYCPEQSRIEPVWNDVKGHQLPIRSFERVAELKHAVDGALAQKALHLLRQSAQSTIVHHPST